MAFNSSLVVEGKKHQPEKNGRKLNLVSIASEHRWGFVQLIIQMTHPSGKFFAIHHIRRNLHDS